MPVMEKWLGSSTSRLPYNVEDDTKVITKTDAHLATFAGSDSEIRSSKEVADVEKKKIDETDI
jgi:hypothetical protein